MAKLLVFDGDDTLWSTMPLYSAARARFCDLVAEKTGASPSYAAALLERLDGRNVRRYRFSPKRFPTSMAEAYDELAKGAGQKRDSSLRRRLYSIGAEVFNQRARTIPGARRVLAVLRRDGFTLVLCTKGNPKVQRDRINYSGLGDLFDKVYIVPEKTAATFRRILSAVSIVASESWSIGNSVRSDINPALRIGMSAIWLPRRETWPFEHQQPIRTDRLQVATNVRGLPQLFGLWSPR